MHFNYPSVNDTEIYVSDSGYVCFKQNNYPQEDQLILLTPHQTEWLLSKLPQMLQEAETLFDQKIRLERSSNESEA